MNSVEKNTGDLHWGGRSVRRGAGARARRAAECSLRLEQCQPAPVWLAALAAVTRRATRDGQDSAVGWRCAYGRATYTNGSADAEMIQPLGVSLRGGQTLAVSWAPGASSYTLEVYGQN
jgi:hypothetical protein